MPPVWSDYEFAGWVPCVTGRLSFSAIGSTPGSRPYKVRRFSMLDEPTLAIPEVPQLVIFQRRPNSEFPWPQRLGGLINEWLENRRKRLDGNASKANRWRSRNPVALKLARACRSLRTALNEVFPRHSTSFYLMQAWLSEEPTIDDYGAETFPPKSDPKGALFGEILLVRKRAAKQNRRLVSLLLQFNSADPSDRPARWTSVLNACCEHPHNRVSFQLFRSGEVRLKLPNEVLPSVPNEGEDVVSDPPHQVRQVYYFLKDCAHKHYHHHAHADQILRVRCVGSGDLADVNWRRETLWDLARAAIKMRRERQFFRRRDALGVLAYAQAFQSTLARVRRTSVAPHFEHQSEIAKYDFEHLKQSISAENDSSTFRIQGATSVFLAFMALSMTLVVMHHSATSILMEKGQSQACVLNPSATVWLVLALALQFAAILDINFRRGSWYRILVRLYKDQRVSSAGRRWWLAFLAILFAAIAGLSWFDAFPLSDFAGNAWHAINPLCLAD